MQTLKAFEACGSGPGLIHLSGSFTETSAAAVTLLRPSKGNFTVTKLATGVFALKYVQPCLSVSSADVIIGPTANIVGAGSVSYTTANPGYVQISQEFLTGNATQYRADPTNTTFLIQVINAANNALASIYGLGNYNSVANYRVSFDITLCTSAMNK